MSAEMEILPESRPRLWCTCKKWDLDYSCVARKCRDRCMNFCPFCGKALCKNRKLRPVPKSLIGDCVGHHPDRRIYRRIEERLSDDPHEVTGHRLIRAHRATGLCDGDLWCR